MMQEQPYIRVMWEQADCYILLKYARKKNNNKELDLKFTYS